MFTDKPTIPLKLEILLEVVENKRGGIKKEELYELIQPSSLSNGKQDETKNHIFAAKELELLVEEKSTNTIKLSKHYNNKKSAKDNILSAIDRKVLTSTDVEYHLALFYSYILGLGKELYKRNKWKNTDWPPHFYNDVQGIPDGNAFNYTKFTALHRWFGYIGLGWYDTIGQFQPDPTERLLRNLPSIFEKDKKLDGDIFMSRLAEQCPELDGGKLFLLANKNFSLENKQCSLGLSQALITLHEEEEIILNCQIDSDGWDIKIIEPSIDNENIKSSRISQVSLKKKGGK